MKKYVTIFLSLAAFVLNFLCFWHFDMLLNRFFVFGLIPVGLSLLVFLVDLIVSIIFVVRYRTVIIYYVALAISVMTVVVLLVFPFQTVRVNLELQLYEKDRVEIIEMVKNGEITIDHLGNAKLPKEFEKLSSDGYIFVYQNDNEQVISFWVFRGMLSGSVELIYSSTDETLIYENESGHPITNIQKLKEHWYLVDTDY